MKRVKLLLLIVPFIVGTVSAQQRVVNENNKEKIITVTRVIPKNQHDIRVGVGSVSVMSTLFLDGYWSNSHPDLYYDFGTAMSYADTYTTKEVFLGMYSLSYTYHFRRWFQFGGTAMIGGTVQSRKDIETNKRIEGIGSYCLSVMPTVRFVYLCREKVQLYSSLSFGVVGGSFGVLPWGDVTLLGCTFGKKLFGFTEIGMGVGGWGRVGIGYRFDSVKKYNK